MKLNRRWTVPRGLLGIVNQIALSVVASLIATTLWSELRPDRSANEPALLRGDKLKAHVDDGTRTSDSDAPVRPMAVWAFAPHTSATLLDDQGWGALQAQATPTVTAVLARPIRVVRTVRRITTAVGGGPAPVRPAAAALAEPQVVPAPETADKPGDLWSTAAAAARTVVAFGATVVGHLLP